MNDNLTNSEEKAVWKKNAADTGLRLLFIILFGGIFYLAAIVTFALVIFQLGHTFITGNVSLKLQNFSKSLTAFMHRVLDYLTFNTDTKPFPFDDWPAGD